MPDTHVMSIQQRLLEMGETSELLTVGGDLNILLFKLAERARTLTDADFAALGTFGDDSMLNRFIYSGIDERTARMMGNPPIGRGLLGELARQEVPLRIDDLQRDGRFTGWPEGHPDMCAFIGVPIRAGGRTIGSIYMTRVRGRESFNEGDELAAAILALQAAATVVIISAHERTGRLALLEERERIAHDLHDGTIQMLYALGLECDAMACNEAFPEDIRDDISAKVVRINQMITDIRSYITMLESDAPQGTPNLPRDLAFVVRQLVPPGVHTMVNVTAAALQELGNREVEDLLYIAREAISNAVRHSGGSKIAVDLRQSEHETALTVQDNGIGFDPAHVRTGLGTVTMRTRADRLGADLTVLAIPGMGVTVRVAVPRRRDD